MSVGHQGLADVQGAAQVPRARCFPPLLGDPAVKPFQKPAEPKGPLTYGAAAHVPYQLLNHRQGRYPPPVVPVMAGLELDDRVDTGAVWPNGL